VLAGAQRWTNQRRGWRFAGRCGAGGQRAACSVSYKGIFWARPWASRRAGRNPGNGGSVASAGVLVLALLLMSGLVQDRGVVIAADCAGRAGYGAGRRCCFQPWTRAPATAPRPRRPALPSSKKTRNLRRFILVRLGLLSATRLRPPYFVVLAGGEDQSALRQLGRAWCWRRALRALLLALMCWGRLSETKSQPRVLMFDGHRGGRGNGRCRG